MYYTVYLLYSCKFRRLEQSLKEIFQDSKENKDKDSRNKNKERSMVEPEQVEKKVLK